MGDRKSWDSEVENFKFYFLRKIMLLLTQFQDQESRNGLQQLKKCKMTTIYKEGQENNVEKDGIIILTLV